MCCKAQYACSSCSRTPAHLFSVSPVYTWLDVKTAYTPTSTREVKNKLLLQRDAFGDNWTNRTFQLQPQGARNSVCISRVGMTGTVSTCTFPLFAGFSTCETFLAFCFFVYPFFGKGDHSLACPFQSSFLCSRFSTFVLGLAFLLARLFSFAGGHLSIPGLDPLPAAFDVLDFSPAPAGDLTFFFSNITCPI